MGGGIVTAWFTSPETTPRATCPNEVFVRFAMNNFKPGDDFLEIGSGDGMNLQWLEQRGFIGVGVDSAPKAVANFHCTAEQYFADSEEKYSCIFDINTLCHVEHPPYDAIHAALKPGGKFFSITPALDTEADFTGKGYTCRSSRWSLRARLDHFSHVDIWPHLYYSRGIKHSSWHIEASK